MPLLSLPPQSKKQHSSCNDVPVNNFKEQGDLVDLAEAMTNKSVRSACCPRSSPEGRQPVLPVCAAFRSFVCLQNWRYCKFVGSLACTTAIVLLSVLSYFKTSECRTCSCKCVGYLGCDALCRRTSLTRTRNFAYKEHQGSSVCNQQSTPHKKHNLQGNQLHQH